MIGFPLDSHVTYLPDGTPVYDRAITSAPYRKLIKSLFSDGVLPNPSTNMQVSAATGLAVNVFAGFALCNGCQKLQETNVVLSDFQPSDTTYDRIDTVVLRLDDNDDVRECELHVVTGTPASKPTVPALTQTNSIWEIGLANVLIKANSTQISNANITDTRYDSGRCGIISSISQFDTTTLYQQIQTDLAEFKEINQADFISWFEYIKEQLSTDQAGHLQNQIGNLENLTTEDKENLVDAVNELVEENKNIVERLDNGEVDTLTSMEQVNASTDKTKPVGAGAVQELNDSLKSNYITSSLTLEEWLNTYINENSVPADREYHVFNNDTKNGSFMVRAIRIGNYWCGEVHPITTNAINNGYSYNFVKEVGKAVILKSTVNALVKTISLPSESDMANAITTAIENNVTAGQGSFNFFLACAAGGYCVQGYATPTHASGIITQQAAINAWQFIHPLGDTDTSLKNISGSNIVVDSVLSASSANPVQNKVITDALQSTYITSSVSLQNWIQSYITAVSVPNDGMYHYFNNDTSEGSYIVKAIRAGNYLCGEVHPVYDVDTKKSYYFSKLIDGTTTLTPLTPYKTYGKPSISFCGVTFKFSREFNTVVVEASGQLTSVPTVGAWVNGGSISTNINFLPSETKYLFFYALNMLGLFMSIAPDGTIGFFCKNQLPINEYVVGTSEYIV